MASVLLPEVIEDEHLPGDWRSREAVGLWVVVVADLDVFVQVQDLLERGDLLVAQRGAARCHTDGSEQLLTALVAVVFVGVGARHGRFGGAKTRFQG